MARIAIISANKELARFFELELTTFGHTCDIYRSFLSVTREIHDLLLVDVDTVKASEVYSFDGEIVYITQSTSSVNSKERRVMEWPASIESIHSLVADKSSTESKNTPDTSFSTGAYKTAYVIDRKEHTVAMGNRYVKLSKTEFALLELLCGADGELVPREQIMRLLGADSGNASDVYICNIRKKLESEDGGRIIFSVRGKGYRTILRLVN